MKRSTLLPLALLFAGCGGLTVATDKVAGHTGIDVGEPSDTDTDEVGNPIDTDEHEATNNPPVAKAGPDQLAGEGDVVQLDGSASSDPDGDTITFRWRFTSGPPTSGATLLNATHADPTFYADVEGTYELELTVSDGELEASDDVVVEVTRDNLPPIAVAGPDQYVDVGDTVQLNGSASSDPDGDPITYGWAMSSKPAGSLAALAGTSTAFPTFYADKAGTYVIELKVHDGTELSPGDSVKVVAQETSSGDCLSCAAAENQLRQRWTMGRAASGPGLVLLPLFAALWHRRRDEDEDDESR